MVWVSNRSSQIINVSITNTTGGQSTAYDIIPEPLLVESRGKNHWARHGAEIATIVLERSGHKFQVALNPLDVLMVHGDAYIVQHSTKQEQIFQ